MATKDDTTSEPEAQPDAMPRYATELQAPEDVMRQRLAQARAFSLLLTGEGFDHFTQFPPEIQHDVLAALDSLLDDAAVAASRACAGREKPERLAVNRLHSYEARLDGLPVRGVVL